MPAYGPDVSDFQESIPESDFIIVKATEGRTWDAESFLDKRDEARRRRRPCIIYHFAHPVNNSPVDEAAHFRAAVGDLREDEGLALDYERPDANPGEASRWDALEPDEHEDFVVAWLDAIEEAYPQLRGRVLFYASIGQLDRISTDRVVRRMPLWVAGYGKNDGQEHPQVVFGTDQLPTRVDRWDRYTLWQYTSDPMDWNRAESIGDVLALVRPAEAPAATTGPGPLAGSTTIRELRSPNGRYRLVAQDDGNVVAYEGDRAMWATGTNGPGRVLVFQPDGNLVVYDDHGLALWASNTWGNPAAVLLVQDDGNVVIYGKQLAATGTSGYGVVVYDPLWSTGTFARTEAPGPPAALPEPAPAPAPDTAGLATDEAAQVIADWNFYDGVAGFQEAFADYDLDVDGVLGEQTARAVQLVRDRGGALTANFVIGEFRCTHCGRAKVHRESVRAWQRVRDGWGPLGFWSTFRCPQHPIEAAKSTPGQHAYGTAADPNPYLPRQYVEGRGFSGIGTSRVGDPGKISHADVRHAGAANVTGSSPEAPAEFDDN